MFINIPNNVQFIIDTFYNNNYEAFMVGGWLEMLNWFNSKGLRYQLFCFT